MSINIKNAEAVRLLEEIVSITRRGKSETLLDLLKAERQRLDAEREARILKRRAAMRELIEEIQKQIDPNGPTREEIDAEMYDEWGLPR